MWREVEMRRPTEGTGAERLRAGAASVRAALPDTLALRAAADRHSRRVRRLKIAIPIVGLVAIAAIVGVAVVKTKLAGRFGVSQVLFSKDGLTMVEPRLTGRSGERRYDVTAAKAFQQVQDPKMIALEGVDGRLELNDGNWAKIESTTGNYDGNHEKLDLAGDVTVVTSTGWRATTLSARVDLVTGRIDAEGEVKITGKTARIDADRLEATDEGRHLVFTGDVRMTVQPEAGSAASPDAAPPAAP
jgi:lipopolysaccharide export system protein LptC